MRLLGEYHKGFAATEDPDGKDINDPLYGNANGPEEQASPKPSPLHPHAAHVDVAPPMSCHSSQGQPRHCKWLETVGILEQAAVRFPEAASPHQSAGCVAGHAGLPVLLAFRPLLPIA